MRFFSLLILFFLMPASVYASSWWNEQWGYRAPIEINTSSSETLTDVDILVRLHAGNFQDFFLVKEDLSDLRFIAGDDQTPLKFHVESFDILSQFMFVWVKVPAINSGEVTKLWMYYGNSTAVSAEDSAGSFDVNQVSVFHVNSAQPSLIDATAYKNQMKIDKATINSASLIGSGIDFGKDSSASISDSPTLKFSSLSGFTISAWFKSAEDLGSNATLFYRKDAIGNTLIVDVKEGKLHAVLSHKELSSPVDVSSATGFEKGVWQFVSVVTGGGKLTLLSNGVVLGSADVGAFELTGDLFVGSGDELPSFVGLVDEVRISNVARSFAWLDFQKDSQGMGGDIVQVMPAGQLGASSSDSGMFRTLLNEMGDSGMFITALLLLMAVISWLVMLLKAVHLSQAAKDNKAFLKSYRELQDKEEPISLDGNDVEIDESPIIEALFGKHDRYQSSPIYHLYHRASQDIQKKYLKKSRKGISDQAANAIRAAMDAQMTREAQKLNSRMILLTIAVSGGPFLGLLGTVLGVMITFAAIAQTGEVDIAAIAPGVAAALLTTVAGLIVAIPALFGYNYLSVKVKENIADMRVFCNEFVTAVAEYYGPAKER